MTSIDLWQGSTADPGFAAAMAVQPTDSYTGSAGVFPFANRDDYQTAMRSAGVLSPDAALVGEPLLAAAAQAHWHLAGANACTFATFLSARRDEFGWETHVITGAADARELAHEVASLWEHQLRVPEVEVVSFLLPELDDEAGVADLLARLGGLTDWEVRREGQETDEQLGEIVRLGVRAAVEFEHWSEALGFGRLPAQPSTRLAPFTEIAIRAKPPKRPRRDQRTYMADIELDSDDAEVGPWWHATVEERARRLVATQDLRGKARVTFSLREQVWNGAAG